jgi:hypothetical protein
MTATSIIAAFAALGACSALEAQAVDVCDPGKFAGAYGFQLSGHTTISGASKAVAAVGRLEFDGQGGVTGQASADFSGYYLGNHVTGKYQASADCTLTWSLQDDSGAWQHFLGRLTADLLAARFEGTDSGAAQNGTLQKVAPNCSVAGLAPRYGFAIAGAAIPMESGDEPPHPVNTDGIAEPDQAGALKLTVGNATGSGTVAIDSGCIATLVLNLPSGTTVSLRGVLVDGGKRIIAVEADPGATATATFNAK